MKTVFFYNNQPYNITAGLFDQTHLTAIENQVMKELSSQIKEINNPLAWIKIKIENSPRNSANIEYIASIIETPY